MAGFQTLLRSHGENIEVFRDGKMIAVARGLRGERGRPIIAFLPSCDVRAGDLLRPAGGGRELVVDEIGFQSEYGRRSTLLAYITDANRAGAGRTAAPAGRPLKTPPTRWKEGTPMIAIHFDKGYAQAALTAIQAGQPIPPPGGPGWTGRAMLTLAGVLYATLYCQGPHAHQLTGVDEAKTRAMLPGQEADEDTFDRDIHDGIEFISHLTFQVLDGKYDEQFGPEIEAVVYEKESGKRAVIPAKGFKGHKDIV
jgi:hypothetical protein